MQRGEQLGGWEEFQELTYVAGVAWLRRPLRRAARQRACPATTSRTPPFSSFSGNGTLTTPSSALVCASRGVQLAPSWTTSGIVAALQHPYPMPSSRPGRVLMPLLQVASMKPHPLIRASRAWMNRLGGGLCHMLHSPVATAALPPTAVLFVYVAHGSARTVESRQDATASKGFC